MVAPGLSLECEVAEGYPAAEKKGCRAAADVGLSFFHHGIAFGAVHKLWVAGW